MHLLQQLWDTHANRGSAKLPCTHCRTCCCCPQLEYAQLPPPCQSSACCCDHQTSAVSEAGNSDFSGSKTMGPRITTFTCVHIIHYKALMVRHTLTLSSARGSCLKSCSDKYSSTGNCCTILLTASKRRLLLVAVFCGACWPATAGLQFQTELHSSSQVLRSPCVHECGVFQKAEQLQQCTRKAEHLQCCCKQNVEQLQ